MRTSSAAAQPRPCLACVLELQRQVADAPAEALARFAIAAAVGGIGGRRGFAVEVGADGRVAAWWEQPGQPDAEPLADPVPAHVDPDLLADAVSLAMPVVGDDDLPGGPARAAIVPLVASGRVVAALGVAGQERDPGPDEQELLELIGWTWRQAVVRRRLEADLGVVEDRMATAEDRLVTVGDCVPDGVVLVDPDGRVQLGNPAAHRLFNVGPGELVGRALDELVDPESLARTMPLLASAVERRMGPFDFDVTGKGSPIGAIRVTAGPWTDRSGSLLGTRAVLHDATAERAEQQEVLAHVLSLNEELARSARTDALTGLSNRLRLSEDAAQLRIRAVTDPVPVAVLMVDIDHFKLFNDRYGHLAGDEALKVVSSAVRGCLRESDGVYRYGGEEILALLPGAPAHAARSAAERILSAVETLGVAHLDNVPSGVVTVSVGVAVFDLAHTTFELALREADAALYAAKELGRNRWVALAA